jgi:sulfate adenylyltransferase subunit 1
MDLLRFITSGSVDDGKSTLIGRLLYDSKNILTDQLEAIEKQTKNKVNGDIDLALLTDGLRAEREQGITIDVAYKYFSTPQRKFIIADAPGHVQYTRNMITGASNTDAIIVLIDARIGISEQTRRHSAIASLLNIPHVLVAVNKMDLVAYDQQVYSNICSEYAAMAEKLGLRDVQFLPISALKGDNVVETSEAMPWYTGNHLLGLLEHIPVKNDLNHLLGRFPVQFVIRPQSEALHDYRGYAGRVQSGTFYKGQAVRIEPAGLPATIKSIEYSGTEINQVNPMQSAVIQLEEDIDISRGDLIASEENPVTVSNTFDVLLCWMDSKPLKSGNRYTLQLNSSRTRASVSDLHYRLDIHTFEKLSYPEQASLNDIVSARIKTALPIAYDSYRQLRAGGGAILIDETSNLTVAAIMIQ